jgi:NitT/TauT family transport system substrate-binding protein
MKNRQWIGLVAIVSFALLGGCGKSKRSDGDGGSGAKVKLMLDWNPEPEFGGFYDANESGAFKAHGLNVTISSIGDGVEPYNMVMTGQADFATTAADHVLIAKSNGNDVVAIFAVYQTSPQGIMVHKARGFKTIGDVFSNPGSLYAEDSSWLDFCKQKFQPVTVKVFSDPKSIAPFKTDPLTSQQCFVTSEPVQARLDGLDPQSFLIADAGFNPYTTVVITRGQMVREHPEEVAAMVAACREGWTHYLADPKPANAKMATLTKEMTPQMFDLAAAEQKPLIETDGGKPVTVGSMTAERWSQLSLQMVGLPGPHKITTAFSGKDCFWEPAAAH